MDIRKANENDLIEVLYLTKKFKELVANADTICWSADISTEIELEEIINSEKLYVAGENTILGTIQLESTVDVKNQTVVFIKNFSVHPLGEPKGLALFMLEFAIKEAINLNVNRLDIEVKSTHSVCIAELKSLNFSVNNSKTTANDILLFSRAITV